MRSSDRFGFNTDFCNSIPHVNMESWKAQFVAGSLNSNFTESFASLSANIVEEAAH
jgi:hypothetical protein